MYSLPSQKKKKNVKKNLNIPPISTKCSLTKAKCFKKSKNSKCIISKIINTKAYTRKQTRTIESQRLISKNCFS